MSFIIVEQAPARLNRSELAVPGSQPQLFEKAAKSAADVVFLDLEDAVAPDDKAQARKNIIAAIGEIDWGTKTLRSASTGSTPITCIATSSMCWSRRGERLDLIMIPKVGTAADVYAVDMLVTQIEPPKDRKKRIGFELIIETALGMENIDEIAARHQAQRVAAFRRRRLCRLDPRPHDRDRRRQRGLRRADRQGRATGSADPLGRHVALRHRPHGGGRARQGPAAGRWSVRRFLRSRRIQGRGAPRRPYWAARANGRSTPRRWRWPTRSISPVRSRGERAAHSRSHGAGRRSEGKGAVSLDGRLIDIASIRQAEELVAKADMLGKPA